MMEVSYYYQILVAVSLSGDFYFELKPVINRSSQQYRFNELNRNSSSKNIAL